MTMTLYPELGQLTLPELFAAYHGSPPEGDDYAAAFFDEVTSRVREYGEDGIRFLLDATCHASGDRLASLLVGLAPLRTTSPRLGSILRRCLHDPAERVVMAAIDALRLQDDCGDHEDVLSLRDHPSSLVRGAVLRYVRVCCPDQAKPMLIAALSDPAPIVRGSAVDELDELDTDDISVLLSPLLSDPDEDVRHAAATAVGEERAATSKRWASRYLPR